MWWLIMPLTSLSGSPFMHAVGHKTNPFEFVYFRHIPFVNKWYAVCVRGFHLTELYGSYKPWLVHVRPSWDLFGVSVPTEARIGEANATMHKFSGCELSERLAQNLRIVRRRLSNYGPCLRQPRGSAMALWVTKCHPIKPENIMWKYYYVKTSNIENR